MSNSLELLALEEDEVLLAVITGCNEVLDLTALDVEVDMLEDFERSKSDEGLFTVVVIREEVLNISETGLEIEVPMSTA
jgi:hypothetical protein